MITSSNKKSEFILNIYIGIFLLFMFIPLLLMMAAGFNATDPPSVTDWQGFTLKWFYQLKTEDRLIRCLGNSFKIVGVVVPLSVMLGLSAALILTRIRAKVTTYLYAVLVSPMLTPGIILGITTIVFWQKIGVNANLFTVMLAQTSFIATYPMLIIMSRLQRQDHFQEEAAMDLGASPLLLFWRITIPFLKPAIFTSAALAFLMSFENYNTTVFSIGSNCTITTEIAQQARKAHTPVINALGFIFVSLTIFGALIYTFFHRRRFSRN